MTDKRPLEPAPIAAPAPQLPEAQLPEAQLPEAQLPEAQSEQSAAPVASAIAEARYHHEQCVYWEQLRRTLDQYKADLGATNTELAQCLGISRQPLVLFMQNSSSGLPIQRANLVRLWDRLTDPAQFRKKHSEPVRSQRQALRQQGPDPLLKAAGFLPNTPAPSLEIHPSRHQQIQRLVTRLSNLPVTDFADFITLTEFLEDFVTNSFPGKYKVFHSEEATERPMPLELEADRVAYWIEKNHLPHPPSPAVKTKLQGALSRLAISGKSELNNAEFFELYMAITENERLSSHIDQCLQMRVTQCQFTTLTQSLHTYLSQDETFLAAELDLASLEAERCLRPQLRIEDDLQDAISDSVIEALITCNFRAKDHNVLWRYSSSTTHFENMLAAIGRGMGYESALEMVDFSIRTLGHKDYSLIRASTAFRPIDYHQDQGGYKTYQSVWVDRSAILSILQSTVIAVRSWLAEKFPDESSCRHYYEVCRTVAEIDAVLVKGKKLLNGYRIQPTELHSRNTTHEYLEKQVIEKITTLKTDVFPHYPHLAQCYEADLDRKYCIAKLACAHSAVIEGNMTQATRWLAEVETFLERFQVENHPLRVSYDMEKKLQQFFLGDAAIFVEKATWRSQLQTALTQLSQHIQDTRQHYGRFDSDIYITASEVLGRLGRLNFVCCDAQDAQELDHAVQQFLMAAYCSAKIGHPQRAAHWISNASRTCCRLGAGDRAVAFANLADRIIGQAIQPPYSMDYREAILAEVNIARGERLLLVEKNVTGALEYFLRSLQGSIYIGFVRLIADNLYNIARAAQDLSNYRVKKTFAAAMGAHGRINTQTWWLNEADQGWQENKTAAEIIQFLNGLDKDKDWSSVAPQFKAQSQKIWHSWANASDPHCQVQHPIAVAMETDQFLDRLG